MPPPSASRPSPRTPPVLRAGLAPSARPTVLTHPPKPAAAPSTTSVGWLACRFRVTTPACLRCVCSICARRHTTAAGLFRCFGTRSLASRSRARPAQTLSPVRRHLLAEAAARGPRLTRAIGATRPQPPSCQSCMTVRCGTTIPARASWATSRSTRTRWRSASSAPKPTNSAWDKLPKCPLPLSPPRTRRLTGRARPPF